MVKKEKGMSLNQYIIEKLLLRRGFLDDKSLSQAQVEQAYARLGFACAGLLYLYLHAEAFVYYQDVFLALTVVYFLATLCSIPIVRRVPLSAWRMLFFPIFDILVVSFGMLIDGGLSSGLFFIFVVIIFGNSFRFGNAMLFYSQACSLIGLLAMVAYAEAYAALDIDYTLLGWQVGALLMVPLYIYLVGKKAEGAMKMQIEAEETSFHLMDKGPLPVFTFELYAEHKPRVIYANAALRELFQYDEDYLMSAYVDSLTIAEDSREFLQFCQSIAVADEAQSRHIARSIYIRSQDKAGNILKLTCTAISMRWRGRWVGVCFIHDITQRETMQKKLESVHRHAYMSTLVAGIVHDFRNVLTNMIGYAEVMQMNSSSVSEQQQLKSIIEAGDRGSELITHLLNLGKSSEFERTSAYTQGHELAQPLGHIIGLARLQLPRYIQLICSIDDPLHDVRISITEVEQVLLNLINNATQAISDAGNIEIQIHNEPNHCLSQPGHPCLHIQVKDNGCGIADEHIDAIFKPFWTSKGSQGGSGLGLTMVQRIIKRNHGSIEVQSTLGKETIFDIYVPPYIPDLQDVGGQQQLNLAKKKTAVQIDKRKHGKGYHVLVVDDVPDILKIHQGMLAHINMTSATAENGKLALEMFQQADSHFDLIITDYKMPEMDGLTLVEHIRELDVKIPILMISAFAEDHQLQQVMDCNATLLNKPINMQKLQEAIADAIDKCRSLA